MKKILLSITIAAFGIFYAYGETITTVKSILDNPDEGKGAVLQGKITQVAPNANDDHEYTFDDGTGTIRVEFDDDLSSYPSLNTDITIGGVQDYDNQVLEVDAKYWHAGKETIEAKLGTTTIKAIQDNPQNNAPWVLKGQISDQGFEGGKYIFIDNSGSGTLSMQNMDAPDLKKNVVIMGTTSSGWGTWFNVFYWEYGEGGGDPPTGGGDGGDGGTGQGTVKDMLDNKEEGDGVLIIGQIKGKLKSVADDEYTFSDGETEARVEFDQDLTIPDFNKDINIGGIVDDDNGTLEIDIKYWHYGTQYIEDKLGTSSVVSFTNNPVDEKPFVFAGKLTGPVVGQNDKYNFQDGTGTVVLQWDQNQEVPGYNKTIQVFGVLDYWSIYQNYNVYYWHYYQGQVPSSVRTISNLGEMTIYPNPAADFVVINSDEHFTNARILDISGKTVMYRKIQNKEVLPLESLAPGVYFLRIYDNERLVAQDKLIKTR